ncbi:MAG: DHH family phosphoesterase [Patescibacteria group bacterium]
MITLEQQIFKQIEKSKNILLAFPSNTDGDILAASLAFFIFLKKLNKNVDLVCDKIDKNNNTLLFLPNYSQIQTSLINLRRFIVSLDISQAKINQIRYTIDNDKLNFIISPSRGWFKPEDISSQAGEFKYDLIIILGTPDLESLGEIYNQNIEFFYKTTIINIDYHPNNEDFGQINYLDLNVAALSEIIFYLFKNYQPELINEDISTCLLAGIISKTNNFKTSNLSPRTLLGASELISTGARREEIISNIYKSHDLKALKLWGKILSNLQSEQNSQLIWLKLSSQELKDSNVDEQSLTEIVDELIASIPNSKIIVILEKIDLANTKIFVYSLKNISALDIIKEYAPNGNSKLASAIIKKDIETTSAEIIPEIKNILEKIIS